MNFTQEQIEHFKKKSGMDHVPNGELVTSGYKFDAVKNSIAQGVEAGAFAEGSKLLGLADMVITEIRNDGVSNLDFIAVVSEPSGGVYLVDPQGVSRYTKEQVDSLRSLLAVA